MRKKIFSILFTFIFVFIIAFPAKAASFDVEYFSNGDYVITEIIPNQSSFSLFSTTATKTKTSTYYNSDGVKCWSVSVIGTFTYGNGSATCKSSSCSTAIYNNAWSVGSKNASKSGNKATASAKGVQYIQGQATLAVSKSVTLTCSPTGQFS